MSLYSVLNLLCVFLFKFVCKQIVIAAAGIPWSAQFNAFREQKAHSSGPLEYFTVDKLCYFPSRQCIGWDDLYQVMTVM